MIGIIFQQRTKAHLQRKTKIIKCQFHLNLGRERCELTLSPTLLRGVKKAEDKSTFTKKNKDYKVSISAKFGERGVSLGYPLPY